jgi:ComF family protein
MLKKGKQAGERLADLVFPRRCALCDEPVDRPGEGVCRGCAERIVYIRAPFCMKCGKQLQEEGERCHDCQTKTHFYVQGISLYDYGSMADSIFRFKYLGRQEYAIFYGRELQQSYGAWLQGIRPDALVPVPIHPSRRRERGYNQAELIAKALSAQSGIPVDLRLISRTKKTLPQKNLTRAERQNNLKRAFKINRNDVKLNVIVIIDDIYTTGSTIDAMAEVLLQAGVGKIYCMTLAAGRGI